MLARFARAAIALAVIAPSPAASASVPPNALSANGLKQEAPKRLISPDTRLRCNACFIDREGHSVAFDPTYAAWFATEQTDPKYLLAAAKMAAVLTFGTTYYWLRPGPNKADWDFPDAYTRLTSLEATFDNNRFETNHLLHPLAGGTYYLFARESDLMPLTAFAYSAASSAIFEFFLEWLEKVSINDLIFTPGAGVPAGEFVFQLSEYLNSAPAPKTPAQAAFAYTLGLASAMHDGPRGVKSAHAMPADNLGLSSAWWHRFRVAYGYGQSETELGDTETFHRFNWEAELHAMPGLLRPGRFATDFGQGNFNEMRLRLGVSSRGLVESDLWFHSTLAGYYTQSFQSTRAGLTGQAAMIGASMGWRYHDRNPLGRRDRYSFVHLLGPHAKTWLALGGLLARIEGAAHLDFGAIYSLPYDRYVDRFGEEGMKSVLQNYNYAFFYGHSNRLTVALSYGSLEIGARRGYGYYHSFDGRDRFQDEIEEDIPAHEDVSELDLWMIGGVPHTPLELRLDYNEIRRSSELLPLRARRTDRAISASVGARF